MGKGPATGRRFGSIILGVACLGVAAAVGWSVFGKRTDSVASVPAGEITSSIASQSKALGPSGLPIPRFVSLKAEKVNVRRGPSSDHPVAWVFQRKGLPVEIVAEFENWRRVRDAEGEEGWILQNMLSPASAPPWWRRGARARPCRSSMRPTRRAASSPRSGPGLSAKCRIAPANGAR